jgi:hypothetical protein
MRTGLTQLLARVSGFAVAAAIVGAALTAAPVSAQVCAYNSTQATCACPTSGGGTTCFGGQLYKAADSSCQNDGRSCASNQQWNCSTEACECNTSSYPCGGCTAASSTVAATCSAPTNGKYTNVCGACACPAGTTLCGSSNTCVTNLSCPAGTTFDPCTNTCGTPYVLLNPTSTQSGGFKIDGNMVTTTGNTFLGNDLYLPNGKAIRVDGAGVTSLNIGNWGAGGSGVNVNIPTGSQLCFNASCRSSWPSSVDFDPTYLNAGGDTMTGTLTVSGGYGTVNASASNLSIGAGGATPNAVSESFGNNSGWKWNLGTNAGGVFTPRMTVVDTGAVGIGTTSPTAGFLLDVNGAARMTGFQLSSGAGAGKVLTSDASGNGTWQAPNGVSSVTGSGAGISVSPTTGNVFVTNTGVTSIGAGVDISASGATGAVALNDISTLQSVTSRGATTTAGITVGTGNPGTGLNATGSSYGVYGSSATYGVYGNSPNIGVQGGTNATTEGVVGNGFYGVLGSGTNTGVYATGTANTNGVYAVANGTSGTTYGVQATATASASGIALYGNGANYGLYSAGGKNYLAGNTGIAASAPNVPLAVGGGGTNVYGTSAWIENNLHVQGNESVGGYRGRLRVGTAWNTPGLYAESNSGGGASDLVLGSTANHVWLNAGNFGQPSGSATLELWGSRISDTGSGVLNLASGGSVISLNDDVSLNGKHAFRSNDSWLRLNQDGAFTSGTHTPGNFAPGALNVGGANGWGNPGGGNMWVAGSSQIYGNENVAGTLTSNYYHSWWTADAWNGGGQSGATSAPTYNTICLLIKDEMRGDGRCDSWQGGDGYWWRGAFSYTAGEVHCVWNCFKYR